MRTLFVLALFLALTGAAKAQDTYSKATIRLNDPADMKRLGRLGLEVDHGLYSPKGFTSYFSASELARVRMEGFAVDVLVADAAADFVARSRAADAAPAPAMVFPDDGCDNLGSYAIPQHWHYGKMGGHLTFEEAMNQLDSMRLLYPNLITARAPVDTIRTFGNRALHWVRIARNADVADTTKPAVLFTALHHAREPVGLHQLIWFMWDLLEKYGRDPELTSLVDKTQIYFLPVLNPDGYIHNYTTNPDGGGMWRKNRRDNGDGTRGVDINRNYGQNWGYDDVGSSPNTSSETYRGEAAFSEPESRAARFLARKHKFRLALNYHTFSDVIIYPWGHEDIETPDAPTFRNLAGEINKESHYAHGTCAQVLFYLTNGGSDDYLYVAEPGKPRIYAFTPEVGEDFWPLRSEIIPQCRRTQYQNLVSLRAAHPFGVFRDSTGLFLRPGYGANAGPQRIRYKLRHIGTGNRGAAGAFSVTFQPIGAGHNSQDTIRRSYANIPQDSEVTDSVIVPEPPATARGGNRLAWQVRISNGVYTVRDTIYHYDGTPQSGDNLRDACDADTGWTGGWVLDRARKAEGTGCLSDSPGDYTHILNDSVANKMTRNAPFQMGSNANWAAAELSMQTRYDITRLLDYGAVLLSQDQGQNWTVACSDQTHFSSIKHFQGIGLGMFDFQTEPYRFASIRDGVKRTWSREYIDLQPYIGGGPLYLRLVMGADDLFGGTPDADGMYVDDIRIRYIPRAPVEVQPIVVKSLRAQPNPFAGMLSVEAPGLEPVAVYDALGRPLLTQAPAPNLTLDLRHLPDGLYTLRQGGRVVRIVKGE